MTPKNSSRITLKSDGTKKNFIFQLLYQSIILIIPLIISPYLTRTLGKTALGDYTFTYSIMCYFSIFANLGISKHGQRIIAESRDDSEKLRKCFWSLFLTHIFSALLSCSIYLAFSLFFAEGFKTLYLIHGLVMISTIFDITWFYYGIEKFKNVVIKNALIKVVELVLIFIFVKTPNDLGIYTLIMGSSTLVGMLLLVPYAVKAVPPIKISIKDCFKHIKPLLILLIAVLASSIYSIFDKTLLGWLSTTDNVAIYEYSNRIILVPRSIAIVIGAVMYPKSCWLVSNGEFKKQDKLFSLSLLFVNFISFGAIFGLMAVSNSFAIIYYGEDFSLCGGVMMALTPTIFTVAFSDIVRNEYLIPLHKDKEYVLGQVFGAILNLCLSTLLVIMFGIYGAVLGSVISELFVMCYQTFLCRKYLDFGSIIKNTIPFIVCGAVMWILCFYLSNFFSNRLWLLIAQVVVGAIVYSGLVLLHFCCFAEKPIKIRQLFLRK